METEPQTLLAVLAHPDDESFGMGGTLARYAHDGKRVHLITATRGEAGDVDPVYLQGYESIAALRTAELCAAAQHLGIMRVHFLDYRDSGMQGSPDNDHPQALAAAPLREVAEKVAHLIREVRPQVVVTFDPIGGYKHPDHIAIQRATVAAFELAGQADFVDGLPPYQPQKLYFHLIPRRFVKFGLFLLRLSGQDPRHFGKNKDIDLTDIIADGDLPIHARVPHASVQQAVADAVACHASQGGQNMSRGPLGLIRQLSGQYDYFMRTCPPPVDGVIEKDLFAGVQPD